LEISDLGFIGSCGVFDSGGFAAGGADFWARAGFSEAGLTGASGPGLGSGCDAPAGFRWGGPDIVSTVLWIFLRTIFGVTGSFAGWSQPSKPVKNPIKQATLQIIMRFFFMAF
jgi:hypothetical protein